MSDPLLSIIGRGRLGKALATALKLPNLPHTTRPRGWIGLAVPDDAIPEMATFFPGRCFHFSGSLDLADIPCAHPLTSFTGVPSDWTGVPLALTRVVPTFFVREMRALGFAPFELSPEHKALYHAAAVLTSGHAATLWLGAQQLLNEAGIQLPGLGLLALAQTTLRNIETLGEQGRTGPFVRGDEATIARDAAALPTIWRHIFLQLGRAPINRSNKPSRPSVDSRNDYEED
ncbi:MAG: DUF2520 domain-containing protein [Myxococcales bacterium]|nr:DUF2520 domain-containing protein [Myxococcales bacterium]